MKINKTITDNVTNKVEELKNTLVDATIELLSTAYGEDEKFTDIKLLKPICIVENASTDDSGRVRIDTFVVDTISFKTAQSVEGKTYDGYYLLSMGDRCLASSTFMNIANYITVFEAVKALVRRKK